MLSDHLGPRPVAWKMTPTGKQKKKKGKATGMRRNLVTLTLSVFLLGAALMANVGDGRGSWLTRASR